MTQMKLSKYTFLFAEDGKHYLYNSRSNFFSEITEAFHDTLQREDFDSLPEEILNELNSREIILPESDMNDYYYTQLMDFNARNNDRSVINLVLAPTTACNFDCPYCFESKKNPRTMTDGMIDSLYRFVKSHQNAKHLHITWYGGEPLLAINQMEKIHEKLSKRRMPKIESQTIVTNGYCFDQRAIDFFKRTGCDRIQITIDGVKERHDKTRRLKNSSESTFDRIIRNIDRIITELPDTRLDIRVNINRNNYRDFVEVHRFFKEKYPDNGMISAYPGLIREETEDKRTLCDHCFSTSQKIELDELLKAEGIDTSLFPRKSYKGCMMHSSTSYLIGPEGEIYKCWNDVGDIRGVVGNINEKTLSNAPRYIKYAVQTAPFNDECRDCHAFPICDGGCAHHRYRNMFEGCRFDLCSPYRDKETLKHALLDGVLKTDETA